MRHIEMLPQSKQTGSRTPLLARTTAWVRAPVSGIVNNKVKLGSSVAEGQSLAIVSNPLGSSEEAVVAPFDGIVIGCNNLPLAHEGDALFNLAAFKSVMTAESRVEEFVAEHDPDYVDLDS